MPQMHFEVQLVHYILVLHFELAKIQLLVPVHLNQHRGDASKIISKIIIGKLGSWN